MKLFAPSFLRPLIAGVAWLALGVSSALAQAALPNAQVGQSYSYQVTTNPAAAAGTVYAATGLPSGVSINTSSGLISGTPTTAGTATGSISLTASGVTNSFSYTLLVNPATGTPAITSATTATATVGTSFSYAVTASNTPTSFNIGTLPAGLSVGGTTTAPTITGTPTTAGTYSVSLSANNASGTGTTVTLTLTVNPAGPVPVISSATTATATPNVAFTYNITATNTPLSFAATGLPLGLSLNTTTGAITGTPTVAGVNTVSLTATNNNGTSAVVKLTLTVGAVSSITSAATASAGVGVSFSYTITASNSPSSFNVTGLPNGLSANTTTGAITGTPTTAGTYSVSLSANNSVGPGPVTTLTLTVGNPPIITSATTASAVASTAFTYSIVATNSPTSYAVSGLPVGLSVNTTTGVISGTANLSGTFNLSMSAANGSGSGPSVTLVLTVTAPPAGTGGGGGTPFPVTITGQPSSQAATAGSNVTFSVAATGTSPTYQWRKDGVDISGATASSLTLTSVTSANAGSYTVVVSNTLGPVTSNAAQLTVSSLIALPQISAQPASQSVLIGANVTFRVTASSGTLTYQWSKDGVIIPGATSATLTLTGVSASAAGRYSVVVRNEVGSTTSSEAILGVTASSITGAYFGTFAGNGGDFALYVRSDRTGVFLAYARASKVALVSRDVVIDANGAFSVSVSSAAPSTVSASGPAIAAADATYVVSGTISASGSVSGSVSGLGLTFSAPAATSGATSSVSGFYQAGAAGSSAASYAIVGAAGDVLVVTVSGTTADAGTGTVTATGAITVNQTANAGRVAGSIQSSTVSLTATPATGSPITFVGANNDARVENEKLLNISTRSQTGSGANALIAGFVITGTQPKPVLVRAIGPTLAQFGVNGSLTAAHLDVYRGSTLLRSGDNWAANASDAAAITATAARVGAFALAATSRDAALLLTLEPGSYTAIVSGQGGATGVSLVEVYDATEGPIPNAQRVVNISSRASVGSLDSTLIGGFYVSGSVPKRVLVRGVGPGLAQFGLTGTLARTQLTLFRGTTSIAQNTGWGTSADAAGIASAAAQVGAFAFAAGSQDSAILISLEPGTYTAQVAGVTGATGVALVEIYEVP